ncbi:3'(2'),5'-bisphosphate nucleotidase CysQ [Rubrivirga litoralis]|uniref:3'(2'),5'-bisphosphate nucleotidase CysQ n=1 Tax=Rubrivirga litoralis TaxID=3075598 RepID=A0ABU3BPL2_9BACT|nr:3'(2'),5'-bisphosphate nucleotidase CysQ [Rubrivirga sp. F394]MDT0631208.1 3'(2'),5'-bisphosphate nucleotidase CysQ [Rubrivirga sp. F394]
MDLLDTALDAALAGGAAILPLYGRPLPVDHKADDSPLTQADTAAHRAIVGRLAATGLPVLSEEGDPEDADGRDWRRFWCVDPLDGTKEFVKGAATPPITSGEFTVNVALIEDGAPVLGVVHVPVHGVTYYAAGGAAWKRTGGAEPVPISTRRAPEGSLTVVASRDHAGAEVDAILARVEAEGRAVEAAPVGSSLKFCLVAEGRADFYPRTVPTFEWDTAAAQAVVEAAGGGVATRDGARLAYNKSDLRNPSVFCWGDSALDWRRWLADS